MSGCLSEARDEEEGGWKPCVEGASRGWSPHGCMKPLQRERSTFGGPGSEPTAFLGV